MNEISIREINDLNTIDTSTLVAQSLSEGFSFVMRLVDEYQNGKNRFDKQGEILYGAFNGVTLIAIGGLNIDPYAEDTTIGRLRHLYVHPEWRKQGVGKAVVAKVIEYAKAHFPLLRLRTFNQEAALFYVTIGFDETNDLKATHSISLKQEKKKPLDQGPLLT